ncbi:MAG: hypothetical protein ACK46E_04710, partial [Pseudanabaena sp.]
MKSYLFIAAAAIALFGCESQPSSNPSPPVPSATTSNSPTNQAIAKVSLIEDKPVFVASQQNPQPK